MSVTLCVVTDNVESLDHPIFQAVITPRPCWSTQCSW